MKDIHDVIKHAKFGDDRLRGSGVVAGQISAFPIDFVGRPYNTLTLPCERVIHSRALAFSVFGLSHWPICSAHIATKCHINPHLNVQVPDITHEACVKYDCICHTIQGTEM